MEQKVFERKNSKHNKSCLLDEACLRIKTESPNANYDTSLHMLECSQKYSDNNLPAPTAHPTPHPSSLRRAVFTQRLVSSHVYEVSIADHRPCRSENQNTSVIFTW